MIASDDASLDRLLVIFDDYAAVIKALLLRIVGDEEKAEDLLTETFVAAWKQIPDSDVEPFVALIEVARERALEWLRKNRTMDRVDGSTEIEILVADSPLANLPIMQRLVVEHVFFDGGSVSRFAREMQAPRDRISGALANALSALWDDWRNRGVELICTCEASGRNMRTIPRMGVRSSRPRPVR